MEELSSNLLASKTFNALTSLLIPLTASLCPIYILYCLGRFLSGYISIPCLPCTKRPKKLVIIRQNGYKYHRLRHGHAALRLALWQPVGHSTRGNFVSHPRPCCAVLVLRRARRGPAGAAGVNCDRRLHLRYRSRPRCGGVHTVDVRYQKVHRGSPQGAVPGHPGGVGRSHS